MQTKTLHIKVTGVTFEGRQDYLAQIDIGDPVRIVPEPDNVYDPNALAVHVAHAGNIWHVGYIPRILAAEVAQALQGEMVTGYVFERTGGFVKWDGSEASYGLVIRVDLPVGAK